MFRQCTRRLCAHSFGQNHGYVMSQNDLTAKSFTQGLKNWNHMIGTCFLGCAMILIGVEYDVEPHSFHYPAPPTGGKEA